MHPYRVSPVNVTESATSQPSSNGSNSSPQRRLATVSPSTSPRSHSFYGSSPNSNVPNSGQYWQPVANRNKFKTWSKGSDKKTPTVTLTSTSTSTTTTNMTQNPPQPSMNSTPPQKPKRERPTTKSMSIQSFEAHQQKLEQNQTQMMMRASPPPILHREQHLRNETRRPRSQSTNSSNNMKQNSKQTQFYRKKKPILVDAVTQTTIDACTQTSEDDFELAMSLYKQKPQQESFQPISAPSSTPSTNTVSTQTLVELPLPIPNRERLTGTASMQRSLSTNTMNIPINSEEFEELQKQLNKFQQQKDAILSKSRPLSFTAMPVPTAVKVNAVTLTVPQPQPLPPSPTFERSEQLGPSKSPLFHSADSVLNDLNDLEEEIAFMRYKALSLQESVQWLQREKSSRPIAPGPFPQVEFTDSKTLSVNTPKKVEPNKPEKRPNTPFDFMPDLQGPDQSKRQNIASPSSAFASGSVAARLNKTRMSQSLTALPDLKM